MTYLYLEYDQATDTLAPASQSLGAGSMFPIEGEPGKCLIKCARRPACGPGAP